MRTAPSPGAGEVVTIGSVVVEAAIEVVAGTVVEAGTEVVVVAGAVVEGAVAGAAGPPVGGPPQAAVSRATVSHDVIRLPEWARGGEEITPSTVTGAAPPAA